MPPLMGLRLSLWDGASSASRPVSLGGDPTEVSATGNEPEADGLGLQGFLGQGGPDGQQQPAQQKAPAWRFSSVNFAATISRQFFKTLHMDHIEQVLRQLISFWSGQIANLRRSLFN